MNSFGSDDIFISKLDADGNWLWTQQAGDSFDERGFDIAADSYGNCFVTGYFSYQAAFGPIWLDSFGQHDIFICKLAADGDWLWADHAGGIQANDFGNSITTDNDGNCYATGRFNGTAGFGSHTLVSAGSHDVFVTKIGSGISVDPQQIPAQYYLHNYPNPFNPSTTIEFKINSGETGILIIYNINGQKLLQQSFAAGFHSYIWNAENLASGIYLCRIQTASNVQSRKMLLCK